MRERTLSATLAAFGAIALLASAAAAPEGWHEKLEDGLKAAKRSGRPVLVITTWTDQQ